MNYYYLIRWLIIGLTVIPLWVCGQINPSDTAYVVGNPKRPIPDQLVLSGKISAESTNDLLPGATLLIEGFSTPIETDGLGYYRVLLFPGEYVMTASHPQMASLRFQLQLYNSGAVNIRLGYPSKELEEVVLEAYSREEKVSEVSGGVERMSIQDIKLQPALMGETDVISSLQWMPGVSSVGEGAAGFNVRGGNIDQNLVLLDGVPLYNPTHMLGFLSAFHPDVVKGYSLYKGHVPARYGGRAASVLAVESGPTVLDSNRFKIGIGPVTARLSAEGAIGENRRTRYVVGARGGYADWLIAQFDRVPDVFGSRANFQEGHVRVEQAINDYHRLTLTGYGSRDLVQVRTDFRYSYQTAMGGLSYYGILNESLTIQAKQHWGRYEKTYDELKGAVPLSLTNGLIYMPGEVSMLWLGGLHKVRAGLSWQYTVGLTEELISLEESPSFAPFGIDRPLGLEAAVFIEDEWELSPRWAVSLGLRFAGYGQLGPETEYQYAEGFPVTASTLQDSIRYESRQLISRFGGLEPRFSLRFKPRETTALRVSAHRMQQFVHLISNAAAPTPIDLWLMATSYAPPQVADQVAIGWLEQWQAYRWELSVEGFYKQTTNLVEYRDFAQLLGNRFLPEQIVPARGRAYGIEASIQRLRGVLTGRLSYAYVRSLVQTTSPFPTINVNDGEWFPANFDQPHQLDLLTRIQLGKASYFAFNGVYRRGRPYTLSTGNYYVGTGQAVVAQFGPRNSGRIPDYIRVDVSFTLPGFFKKLEDDITLSLYNAIGRRNAYSVFYLRPGNSFATRPFKLSILGTAFPAVVYSLTF